MNLAVLPMALALVLTAACDSKPAAPADKAAQAKSEKQEAPKDDPVAPAVAEAPAPVEEKEEPPAAVAEPEVNPYAEVNVEDGKRVLIARGYKIGKITEPLENVTMVAFEKKAKSGPVPKGGALVFREKAQFAAEMVGKESDMVSAVLAGPDRTIEVRMPDDATEREAILADLAKGGE